jgi:hypothetical protein
MGIRSKLAEVLTRKKAHGDDLRAWLHDQEIAASKRAKEEAKNHRSGPRGVNRVPANLQGLAPTEKYVIRHEDDNYKTRRAMAKFSGGRMERVAKEDIPPFRARKNYKPKASKGRRIKGSLRSSTNQSHVNPKRSKFI